MMKERRGLGKTPKVVRSFTRADFPLEFRASWWIRGAVLLALLLWSGIGVFSLISGSLSLGSVAAVGFFVIFFLGFCAHYWSLAYVVDEYGVTVRGTTAFDHFAWEDIEEVSQGKLPLSGEWVTTKRGGFVLAQFIGGRDKLLDLIVARAGLFPT